MNKSLTLPVLACLMFTSTIATASGFYLGGTVGKTDIDVDTLSSDESSQKLFVGYQFNKYWGLELALNDFGKIESTSRINTGTQVAFPQLATQTLSFDSKSTAINLVVSIPVSENFSMDLTLGTEMWEADFNKHYERDEFRFISDPDVAVFNNTNPGSELPEGQFSEESVAALAGVGLSYNITQDLELMADYTFRKWDSDNFSDSDNDIQVDMSSFSSGIKYSF